MFVYAIGQDRDTAITVNATSGVAAIAAAGGFDPADVFLLGTSAPTAFGRGQLFDTPAGVVVATCTGEAA